MLLRAAEMHSPTLILLWGPSWYCVIKLIIIGYFIRSWNCRNYSLSSRGLQGVGIMTRDKTCYSWSWLFEWSTTGLCTRLSERPTLFTMSTPIAGKGPYATVAFFGWHILLLFSKHKWRNLNPREKKIGRNKPYFLNFYSISSLVTSCGLQPVTLNPTSFLLCLNLACLQFLLKSHPSCLLPDRS